MSPKRLTNLNNNALTKLYPSLRDKNQRSLKSVSKRFLNAYKSYIKFLTKKNDYRTAMKSINNLSRMMKSIAIKEKSKQKKALKRL